MQASPCLLCFEVFHYGEGLPLLSIFFSVLRSIPAEENPQGPIKAAAQGALWGSQYLHQYLPSIAGAGKSGTRFPNMAAFPRCSRMASLPHRCLTAQRTWRTWTRQFGAALDLTQYLEKASRRLVIAQFDQQQQLSVLIPRIGGGFPREYLI